MPDLPLGIAFSKRAGSAKAGVVDQMIDRDAQIIHDQRELLGSARLSEVGRDDARCHAVGCEPDPTRAFRASPVNDPVKHQIATILRELPRELFTQTPTTRP